MRRRDFLRASATLSGAVLLPSGIWVGAPRGRAPSYLVPMDESQQDHLKAYGLAFRALERGETGAEWFLNYRGGSFLLPASAGVQRDAALEGITIEKVDDSSIVSIKGQIKASNMEAVPLEKAPHMAVYSPPSAAPWDDAVTMALAYAGIKYEKIWDSEVMTQGLKKYDWLHLHHEDFTGQYSKFAATANGAEWLRIMMTQQIETSRALGYTSVPEAKRAVAVKIADFVTQGGFLFAMCTATETLDLALASDGVNIVAGTRQPLDPAISSQLKWDKAFAFQGAVLEPSSAMSVFSDIDGHHVNGLTREELGAFTLFNYSAKIDPVASMLVQNHHQVIPDFYGLTTSFRRSRLKPAVIVLGDELGAPWAKYIHGDKGKGTFTFYGGHDPEDPRHAIGDPPTDLSLHPHSPGYRLILNNVLFPAAKKKELKT